MQADDAVGGDDQHVPDLGNLSGDPASLQMGQVVPIRPDASGLFDVPKREVLDRVAERYVVDFDHAKHVLRSEVRQGARFLLRLHDGIVTCLQLVEAKKPRDQKHQSGI